MSNKWIQLVAVRQGEGTFLFRSRRWSVSPGDKVIVETKNGPKEGVVLMEEDFADDQKEKVMQIVRAFGAAWPLKKVLKKVEQIEVVYDEDDWEGDEHDTL